MEYLYRIRDILYKPPNFIVTLFQLVYCMTTMTRKCGVYFTLGHLNNLKSPYINFLYMCTMIGIMRVINDLIMNEVSFETLSKILRGNL